MTIINQKRDILVNYDKINLIAINPIIKTRIYAYFDRTADGSNIVVLGDYETEERAKEVFTNLFKTLWVDTDYYIMPEK